MQYTRTPQFPGSQREGAHHRAAWLFAAMLLVVACACTLAALPGKAYAKSYTMPQVNIQAQLETDGTLHVVEQRTFDFDGSFSAVWWTLSLLPTNAEFSVNGVRMMEVDDSGAAEGSMSALPEVPFELKWREEGGPGRNS